MRASVTERRRQLSRSLWMLADLTAVAERRSFRARAFRVGSWAIDFVEDPFSATREDLMAVEGIGPGIADLIEEFGRTDHIARLEELAARFPRAAARLIGLPRMTPSRLQTLKTTLGVDSEEDLSEAIHSESVETLQGVGRATADRWLEIMALRPCPSALTAQEAAGRSARLRMHLARIDPQAVDVLESGSVRRLDEWAPTLDLVVASTDPDATGRLLEASAIGEPVETTARVFPLTLHDGVLARITVCEPAAAGSALLETTGTTEFVTHLGSGRHARESAAFSEAGQTWVPPAARVRGGTVPADLVTLGDIRGDLHVHSEASPDGRLSVEEILEAALTRGYEYVAITDHTIGLGFGGLDASGLARRRSEISTAARRFPGLHVLHGAEINIDRDGAPDIDDATLRSLDLVVAGCHSHFDLPSEEQTRRVLTAIAHPAVNVLAHPFGRRIGIRPGFDLDFRAVLEAAGTHDTALEVNGHRDRMDLGADHAAMAADAGVMLAADSDAHRLPEFDNVAVSVGVLQRAHVRRSSVVNALPLDRFLAWLG